MKLSRLLKMSQLMKSFTNKIVMELHGKKKIKLSKWDDNRSI